MCVYIINSLTTFIITLSVRTFLHFVHDISHSTGKRLILNLADKIVSHKDARLRYVWFIQERCKSFHSIFTVKRISSFVKATWQFYEAGQKHRRTLMNSMANKFIPITRIHRYWSWRVMKFATLLGINSFLLMKIKSNLQYQLHKDSENARKNRGFPENFRRFNYIN